MSQEQDITSQYTYHDTTAMGQRRKNQFMSRLYDSFLPPLAPGQTVVEIGPGRGEFARETIRRGLSYQGIEPSLELRARLEKDGIHVIDGTVPPIPLPDNSVDLIHSFDVAEHFVDYREVMRFCSEAYRVLRSNGYLSIIAPNVDLLRWLFYAYEYQHSFPTNIGRLDGVLKDSGFVSRRSRAFMTELGLTRWYVLDRFAAHLFIPVVRNQLFCSVFRGVGLESLLFRIHKNFCDHVGVIGRKPG